MCFFPEKKMPLVAMDYFHSHSLMVIWRVRTFSFSDTATTSAWRFPFHFTAACQIRNDSSWQIMAHLSGAAGWNSRVSRSHAHNGKCSFVKWTKWFFFYLSHWDYTSLLDLMGFISPHGYIQSNLKCTPEENYQMCGNSWLPEDKRIHCSQLPRWNFSGSYSNSQPNGNTKFGLQPTEAVMEQSTQESVVYNMWVNRSHQWSVGTGQLVCYLLLGRASRWMYAIYFIITRKKNTTGNNWQHKN